MVFYQRESGVLRKNIQFLLNQQYWLVQKLEKLSCSQGNLAIVLLLTCDQLGCIPRWPCASICQVLLLRHIVAWFISRKIYIVFV